MPASILAEMNSGYMACYDTTMIMKGAGAGYGDSTHPGGWSWALEEDHVHRVGYFSFNASLKYRLLIDRRNSEMCCPGSAEAGLVPDRRNFSLYEAAY